jgi:hypothetical protein
VGLLVRFTAYSDCRAGEVGGLRVKHLELLRHRAKIAVARKTYGADGATKTGKARWSTCHASCATSWPPRGRAGP